MSKLKQKQNIVNELGCTAAKIDLKGENEKFEGFHGDKKRQDVIPLLQRFAQIIASFEINVTLGSPQKGHCDLDMKVCVYINITKHSIIFLEKKIFNLFAVSEILQSVVLCCKFLSRLFLKIFPIYLNVEL